MEGGVFPESLKDAEGRYVELDCVNCDAKLQNAKLYCGDYCQQFSGTVRYARKAIDEGRIVKAEVQEGIGQRLLMLSGGGYPTDRRALTKQEREAILIRDHRKCQECGRKATEVDHIRGDSSDTRNLRALCKNCNQGAAVENARIITREEDPIEWERIFEMYEAMAQRIAAPLPLRFCDDHLNWRKAQYSIRAARKAMLREIEEEEEETDFVDVDDYLYNAMQKND
jgi:5-methylcytosine-specific restriction endonuclease McrA